MAGQLEAQPRAEVLPMRTTYTTGAITEACTVTAAFTQLQYTVTATAGAGGTITPGSATVAHGGTAAFTIKPQTGFAVASVSGCAGTLTRNTYTTGPVTAACTVTATFVQNGIRFEPPTPEPVQIDASGLLTDIPLELALQAFNADGHELPVALAPGLTPLHPGKHTLTWVATDEGGSKPLWNRF